MGSRALSLLTAVAVVSGGAGAQDIAADTEAGTERYPLVITPTGLRQSLADVPASVTVITAKTLRRFGITSVADALRLVPGMAVTHATGPDYRISYHGTNILSPRRMNVLIDGISVYRPAFSEVEWAQLPVVIDDIDRIEVTRGPNSAAYGPNSMLAVVNIVTKHPRDVERGFGSVEIGSNGYATLTGRVGVMLGPTAISLTANRSQDRGYDMLSNARQGHDSTRLDRLNVRSRTDVSPTASLDLQAALVHGVTEVAFADDYQTSFPDKRVTDAYLGAVWTQQLSPTHELQLRLNHADQRVRQSWRTCPPTVGFLPELFALWRANPALADGLLLAFQAGGAIPVGRSATDNLLLASAVAAIRGLGVRALARRPA